MDPLSISAAVVSLASALGSVTSYLKGLHTKIKDAPAWIRIALAETATIEKAFHQLNAYISHGSVIPPSRAAILQVDFLIATVTNAVLLFSELEQILEPFKTLEDTEARMLARLRVAFREDRVQSLLGRLQWQKHTFNMILGVVQCESNIAAHNILQALQGQMVAVLQSNAALAQRLSSLENNLSFANATPSSGNTSIVGDSSRKLRIASDRIKTIQRLGDDLEPPLVSATYDFEDDLYSSWVYKRTTAFECDVSVCSSVPRSHAWSAFTGVSLSDISNISMIALPLCLNDLSGSTRARVEPQLALSLSGQLGQGSGSGDHGHQLHDAQFGRHKRKLVTTFKSWPVVIDDSCSKVLSAALRVYNIMGDWRQYVLYIVCEDRERRLRMDDKPLLLLEQLKREGYEPTFLLRRHHGLVPTGMGDSVGAEISTYAMELEDGTLTHHRKGISVLILTVLGLSFRIE